VELLALLLLILGAGDVGLIHLGDGFANAEELVEV
jgi:hypothetical protein